MRSLELDALLGDKHLHATFHDSELECVGLNFAANTISFNFMIPCGIAAGRQLAYEKGMLVFHEPLFYYIEPCEYRTKLNDRAALWITDDGPLPNSAVEASGKLPHDLPPDAFAHYFYSSTTNSFIVVAARRASFQWEDS